MPRLFGIVNVTEDSFSEGGRYLEADAALAHARALREDGADVLDLGPASSHPDAKAVSPDEEIRRLTPLVRCLQEDGGEISVDSYRPTTQRWALEQGVAWLNDVRGFADPQLYGELAEASCGLVVMHSIAQRGLATRETTNPDAVLDGILRFFDARLEALTGAGVAAQRIVLDPGMGFFLGDNAETSLHVLRNLEILRSRFGRPLLVSVSRKSFLGAVTGRDLAERGAATLAAELHAAAQGVDYIRTHDVRALRDALRVAAALQGAADSSASTSTVRV